MFKFLKTLSCVLMLFTASQSFASNSDSQFFIEGDLLVWQPHLEGIQRLINVESETTSVVDGVDTGSVNLQNKKFDFDWRAGYRLGLGYNFCSNWVLEGFWTHYRGHGSKQFSKFGLSATGHWDMDYDVVDVLLVTPACCACGCFDWNAFGGIKVALIDSEITTRDPLRNLSSSVFTTESITSLIQSINHVKDKFYFHGFGPEIGVNSRYHCGCGISIFAKAAGSLVFAHFKDKVHVRDQSTDSTSIVMGSSVSRIDLLTNSRVRSGNDDFLCRPVLDLSLGVEWERNFSCCNHDSTLVVKLAWEHHQWFGFNRVALASGDLYLDGVTLSGIVRF